jgi:hypothetical protein
MNKILIALSLIITISFPADTIAADETALPQGAHLYFKNITATSTEDVSLFTISARINPQKNNINAVGAFIIYNPHILEITSIETKNSFCVFFLENYFDNEKGYAGIQCGLPRPGIIADSIIADINFIKKDFSLSEVLYSQDSMTLLNDGLGTNVLEKRYGIIF